MCRNTLIDHLVHQDHLGSYPPLVLGTDSYGILD